MSVEKVPVCCIMGQTDCGKTKLLEYMGSYDDIKKQQQQQNHGGRSAAFFPAKYIEERAAAGAAAAEEREVDGPLSINLPCLLIVDISAVESDSNKRLRAWLSCDLPVLVLDIAVGVDHEIIELVKLLRLFHKNFVLVLNKVDKLLGWKNCPNTPISRAVPQQRTEVQSELSSRIKQVKTALTKEGVEAVRILPTSTVSGEGVADLLLTLYDRIQKTMDEKSFH
ncbi:PREDICTED: eukaryotic translation initiation factor 5B-like [Populus euphratica]|uniref:Eukaryotic translation initiation factor 5B-like n=1 Tax=Populus euphratica TaxID=75702 RepID=A0AAJ6UKK0_POPEU|nr:PREDICTED: eukaryotic translation initiation factor 5B-like [Populus euphratica]